MLNTCVHNDYLAATMYYNMYKNSLTISSLKFKYHKCQKLDGNILKFRLTFYAIWPSKPI